ncbi:MAG: hypothetical protein AAF604_02895 [Acidobacteriota bacterium]
MVLSTRWNSLMFLVVSLLTLGVEARSQDLGSLQEVGREPTTASRATAGDERISWLMADEGDEIVVAQCGDFSPLRVSLSVRRKFSGLGVGSLLRFQTIQGPNGETLVIRADVVCDSATVDKGFCAGLGPALLTKDECVALECDLLEDPNCPSAGGGYKCVCGTFSPGVLCIDEAE